LFGPVSHLNFDQNTSKRPARACHEHALSADSAPQTPCGSKGLSWRPICGPTSDFSARLEITSGRKLVSVWSVRKERLESARDSSRRAACPVGLGRNGIKQPLGSCFLASTFEQTRLGRAEVARVKRMKRADCVRPCTLALLASYLSRSLNPEVWPPQFLLIVLVLSSPLAKLPSNWADFALFSRPAGHKSSPQITPKPLNGPPKAPKHNALQCL